MYLVSKVSFFKTKTKFNCIYTCLYLTQSKNQNQLPKANWKFGNNATHGIIELTLSSLDAFDAYQINAFYAVTKDNKRLFIFYYLKYIFRKKNE